MTQTLGDVVAHRRGSRARADHLQNPAETTVEATHNRR